jgi:hypothetical protein
MDYKTKKLHNFLWNAEGLSRKTLNIMCLIGIFTLGIPFIWAYDRLGNKNLGFFYIIPTLLIAWITRHSFSEQSTSLLLVGFIPVVIYLLGCLNANIILSRNKHSGKNRINQIDQLPIDQLTINLLIEKGLIQSKVFSNKEAGSQEFTKALQMSGGEGSVLSFVGNHLVFIKRFNLAKQFFERALLVTDDNNLIKQIKENLAYIDRKIKKGFT